MTRQGLAGCLGRLLLGTLFLGAPLLGTPPPLGAREIGTQEIGTQIDALFAQRIGPGEPGCAVSVTRDGEWVHKAGYGLANLDYDIPLSSGTVFRIASTSKQFTAEDALELLGRQQGFNFAPGAES